jgi:hypothetical protein
MPVPSTNDLTAVDVMDFTTFTVAADVGSYVAFVRRGASGAGLVTAVALLIFR